VAPDARRLAGRAISTASQVVRHLPGPSGAMGTYFSTQDRLWRVPQACDWERDVLRLLARADRDLARGRIDAALSWFDKALRLSYHPSLHADGHSPLSLDPEGFLRPLRNSETGRILLDGALDPSSVPVRPAPRARVDGEPVRLLVVAQENWTFIRPIVDALRARGEFEVRLLEVDELPAGERPEREAIIRGRYDLSTRGSRMPTPAELADGYEWADVVLVEWAHHILTWITLLDQAPRELLARVHRFEAYTPFPLLTDVERIDRLLYVAPPVHNLLMVLRPELATVEADLVGNMLSRGIGPEPDLECDRFRLVQVGWVREVKDVLFALDVIEVLHRHDSRFHLQLVGPGLPVHTSHDTAYQHRVRERIKGLGPEVVQVLGVRQDVPAIFADAGLVLSSSLHEGTHESVMEGLAAGRPAVIRDWPDTLPYGGASTLYPSRWVVPDIAAAVQRVLSLVGDDAVREDAYAEASAHARAWALEHRSAEVVLDRYREVLTPRGGR
jgi:glycosyltransferase involved in cell wall biosynthesis